MLNIVTVVSTVTMLVAGMLPLVEPASAAVSPQAAASCSVDYHIRDDWGTGCTVDVEIINNSDYRVKGWTLNWRFPGNQIIDELWDGDFSQGDQRVSVSSLDWNRKIDANGGSVSFGFVADYSGDNSIPTNFSLNGQTCTTGTPPAPAPLPTDPPPQPTETPVPAPTDPPTPTPTDPPPEPGPTASPPPATEALRAFPQHSSYTAGSIKPNHVSQAELDQATRDFYDQWKAKHLRSCGDQGEATRYYVAQYEDYTRCVSEGQGWGLIITAMMAGHDPDAQHLFDGLYLYFLDHPSRGNPDLMQWQVSSCGDTAGDNSATDGDLDTAYGLLLAAQQWGSSSPIGIDYQAEADKLIAAIKRSDVNPDLHSIMLGDWVQPGNSTLYNGARTSDFMGDHFRAFQAVTGDPVWAAVIDQSYSVAEAVQTNYSPQTGLLPDFVQDLDGNPRPADVGFLEGARDGWYAYNACRVPMRTGLDYLISGDLRAKQTVDRMNVWVKTTTNGDPDQILDGYEMDGTPTSFGADQMSFAAPFGVSAMVDADNQKWLNDIWDDVVARDVNQQAYYQNTIKLLSMLIMSGNWWNPGTG